MKWKELGEHDAWQQKGLKKKKKIRRGISQKLLKHTRTKDNVSNTLKCTRFSRLCRK